MEQQEIKKRGDELIEKFQPLFPSWVYLNPEWISEQKYNKADRARQCAIICVEETLLVLKKMNPDFEKNTYWHPIDVWTEVLDYLIIVKNF